MKRILFHCDHLTGLYTQTIPSKRLASGIDPWHIECTLKIGEAKIPIKTHAELVEVSYGFWHGNDMGIHQIV